jgi:hypothetical protein
MAKFNDWEYVGTDRIKVSKGTPKNPKKIYRNKIV